MCFAPVFLALLMAQTPAAKAPATSKTAPAKTAAPKTAPAAAKTALKTSPKTSPKTSAKLPAKTAAKTPAKPAAVALTTDDQKTVYALGLSIYRSIAAFDLSPEDIELVQRAILDASLKQPAVELNEWGPKLQALQQSRQARVTEKEKANSAAYLAKAATELGALKTESGLIYKDVQAGTGGSPKASDTVKVHYRGTLIDGTEFDSSYKRNEPAQFPLGQVIPCWTEGVQKMKVGGKAKLVCPSGLAYGDSGRPSIPGGATLLFDIELLEIIGAK
jgi:FKBP-type peptidyl-prolyl cis-trans isomerase FkpA